MDVIPLLVFGSQIFFVHCASTTNELNGVERYADYFFHGDFSSSILCIHDESCAYCLPFFALRLALQAIHGGSRVEVVGL